MKILSKLSLLFFALVCGAQGIVNATMVVYVQGPVRATAEDKAMKRLISKETSEEALLEGEEELAFNALQSDFQHLLLDIFHQEKLIRIRQECDEARAGMTDAEIRALDEEEKRILREVFGKES